MAKKSEKFKQIKKRLKEVVSWHELATSESRIYWESKHDENVFYEDLVEVVLWFEKDAKISQAELILGMEEVKKSWVSPRRLHYIPHEKVLEEYLNLLDLKNERQ